jgi:hypothetical protein
MKYQELSLIEGCDFEAMQEWIAQAQQEEQEDQAKVEAWAEEEYERQEAELANALRENPEYAECRSIVSTLNLSRTEVENLLGQAQFEGWAIDAQAYEDCLENWHELRPES